MDTTTREYLYEKLQQAFVDFLERNKLLRCQRDLEAITAYYVQKADSPEQIEQAIDLLESDWEYVHNGDATKYDNYFLVKNRTELSLGGWVNACSSHNSYTLRLAGQTREAGYNLRNVDTVSLYIPIRASAVCTKEHA